MVSPFVTNRRARLGASLNSYSLTPEIIPLPTADISMYSILLCGKSELIEWALMPATSPNLTFRHIVLVFAGISMQDQWPAKRNFHFQIQLAEFVAFVLLRKQLRYPS